MAQVKALNPEPVFPRAKIFLPAEAQGGILGKTGGDNGLRARAQ